MENAATQKQSLDTLLLALLMEHNFNAQIKQELRRFAFSSTDVSAELREICRTSSDSAWKGANYELEKTRESGIITVNLFEPMYPSALKDLADPPALLFYRGRLPSEAVNDDGEGRSRLPTVVGIVGTRHPSGYGKDMARRLAYESTVAGAVVISGLAIGIDTTAHEGALQAVKETRRLNPQSALSAGVGVIGSGLLNIYPEENEFLASEIVMNGGAVVSEYLPESGPLQDRFPERNRLIAAMSELVIVVEAAARSGSRITARLALELGREVGAVPGAIDNYRSETPNELLKGGAAVIRSIQDITELCQGLSPSKKRRRSLIPKREAEERKVQKLETVLSQFDTEHHAIAEQVVEYLQTNSNCHFDDLCDSLRMEVSQLHPILAHLEIYGVINVTDGRYYSLAEL